MISTSYYIPCTFTKCDYIGVTFSRWKWQAKQHWHNNKKCKWHTMVMIRSCSYPSSRVERQRVVSVYIPNILTKQEFLYQNSHKSHCIFHYSFFSKVKYHIISLLLHLLLLPVIFSNYVLQLFPFFFPPMFQFFHFVASI